MGGLSWFFRVFRTPSFEREFTGQLQAWSNSLSYVRLEDQLEDVARRYRGNAELGGGFPYLSIVVVGRDLPLYLALSGLPSTNSLTAPRENFEGAHDLGMLARCWTDGFEGLVARGVTTGAAREWLVSLIRYPGGSVPSDVLAGPDRIVIEQWANHQLPTLWGKVRRVKGFFERRLRSLARQHLVEPSRIDQLVDKNIHLLVVHDQASKRLDALLGHNRHALFAELQRRGWDERAVEDTTGIRAQDLFENEQDGMAQLFALVLHEHVHAITTRAELIVPARIVI